MSVKLDSYKLAFQDTKIMGATGEKIIISVIEILQNTDEILKQFSEVSSSDIKSAQLLDTIGSDGMEYSEAVANILGEMKFKIEALG